jgi:CHAD domain-containing protein
MSDAEATSRIHRELVAAMGEVLELLDKRTPFPDEAVHSARKAIKKARAALRLLREGLDESVYRKENAALRDAGRFFSPLRDVASLIDAFNSFRNRHPAELRQARYDALTAHLLATRADMRRQVFRAPARQKNCARLLRACNNRVSRWEPSSLHPAIVAGGMQRIHSTGRKTLADAKREDTPEASHEWRKQVKYMSNALKVLDVSGHARWDRTEERVARLADQLGDDHDLAELARYIAGDALVAIDAGAKEILATLIKRRRAKLQKRAFALGTKIYKEKPGRFAARLENQLKGER